MWRQPRAVLAVAFACVIAFMGIGLVDPILKPIADSLGATPSQTSLLFTSYMAVMGVAMLITGAVSSRLGVKLTLLIGLAVIVAGAGLAGLQSSVGGVVAFRAVWGLGNALFIATALTAIVNSARGSVRDAIIFFEAALGLGIAAGPLIGGELGSISWRAPFFGVSVLMSMAFVVTAVLLPAPPRSPTVTSFRDPFRALRYPGLRYIAVTALLYNFGFFTLLAFTPFPLDMSAHAVGLIFFGWGLTLAFTSVVVAPWLQQRFRTINILLAALVGLSLLLAAMALWTESKAVLAACVVIAGAFMGINNTLVTEVVMKAAPVERGVASAAYSFVRFSGGAVAPWLAGWLGENINAHVPFWVGAGGVMLGVAVLAAGRRFLDHVETVAGEPAPHGGREGQAPAPPAGPPASPRVAEPASRPT